MRPLGIANSVDMEPEVEKQVARQRLEEVSEEYNMDIEDVKLEFDYSLPQNIMGRTEYEPGYRPKITVGPSFLDAPKNEQLKTMTHEGFHVKQFNGEDTEWLEQNFDVSDRFLDEVEKARRKGTEKEIEGITEVVTDNLMPFSAQTGYPYLKRQKEAELQNKGIDIESELVEDIQDEIDNLVGEYKEVYQSFEVGDVYMEAGELGDIEYSAMFVGYEEPESVVNDYLEDLTTYEGDDPELDLPDYAGEMLDYLEEDIDLEEDCKGSYREEDGSVSMGDLEEETAKSPALS